MSLKTELLKFKNIFFSCFDLCSFTNSLNPKLSINLITYNNIKTIKRCVNSILDLGDLLEEIVVVDSGSDDGTLEYLETINKVKFIKRKTFEGYSQHRNMALKESRSSWILVLDSDEYLSKSFLETVGDLIKTKIYSGYRIYRRWLINENSYINLFDYRGRFTSSLRLFRNFKNIEYRGHLHEAVFGLEMKRIKKLSKDTAYIYHLDLMENSLEERIEKVLRREKTLKGSGHPEEYLPELYNYPISLL